jgi:subtilisin family serine protease
MTNFLYFQDFTDDGYPSGSTGYDNGHHGTHCASIAAGTGSGDINPETVKQTYSYHFPSTTGSYYTSHRFEIKHNSGNPDTILTMTWDNSGGGSVRLGVTTMDNVLVGTYAISSSSTVIKNMGKMEPGWYRAYCAAHSEEAWEKDYSVQIQYEYDYMLDDEPTNAPVFAGIAPQSNIVSLKVLRDIGSGTDQMLLNAFTWISNNGKNPAYNITTVSMSLGFGGSVVPTVDTAVNNLVDEGFICVTSAGNGGTVTPIGSPGTAQKCITVGSINDAFEVVYYSSNGDDTYYKPDVIAPGGTFATSGSSSPYNAIIAADSNYGEKYCALADPSPNDYLSMQGTSMACPHVAGLAQLAIDAIIQTEGSWTWSQANALRVKQLICMGTWEVDAGESFNGDGDGIPQNPSLNRIGRDNVEGYGMVRADAVIQSITHPTTGNLVNEPFYLDRRSGSYAKDPKVLLFSFNADVGFSYDFSIDVPSTGDFDLVIYDDDYDSATGRPVISMSSINSGLDTDESLTFTPSENGIYYWSIRAVEGYGLCQISIEGFNTAPNAPTNPLPADDATGVSVNPILSVDVFDPDGNTMDVSFYDDSDDSLIGIHSGISGSGTASITWSSLSEGTIYSWYVVVDDGIDTTTSQTWSFTTIVTSTAPNAPTNPNPSDNATGVSTNPILSVDVSDPDGDMMDVYFYDSSDTLIGTDTGVSSGGTASISWLGLSEDITYQWYAIADDGQDTTQSATWSFTVGELVNFTIIWENEAIDGMRPHYFIDLNDDGKLELIRSMPNYITSIYSLIANDYEFYTNISIAVYEFGDYDGDGINELVGRPTTNYDYYFYNFSWEEKTLNLENIWVTGYDDRGMICFGDIDNDGKEELVYADNGPYYGSPTQRRRLISFNGTTFKELHSFDAGQGWDGWAYATLIDIDGDGYDEIACGWGYNSGLDGYVRIFDDSSQGYTQMIQYNFERDTTFLSNFDDHEDLNGDGIEDLIVGNSHTGVDNYRYIIFYNTSTSSFSYKKLTLQSGHAPYQFGTGKISPNDPYARYISFGPQSSTNRYWEDKINLYLWSKTSLSFESSIILQLNDVYTDINPRLNVRDIDGDGFDEIIWDGSNSQGKQVTFFIKVTVQDTTSPTWDQIPIDQVVEYGEGLLYDLNASDLSGIDHWWINDTFNFNITINGAIFNLITLPIGDYSLEVRAYDPYDNYCSAIIEIAVEDTTAPTWVFTPDDQVIELGDGLSYDVDASDLSGIDYYWIDDETNFNVDGNGLITNAVALFVGDYTLEIRAYDHYGHYCTATITITIEDTTAPTWDTPPNDQTVGFGDPFSYDVDASDLSGIDYYWIDDETNFNVDGNGLITNVLALSVGDYTLEIRAYDHYGHYCTATITITVGDTTAPTWDTPPSDQTEH